MKALENYKDSKEMRDKEVRRGAKRSSSQDRSHITFGKYGESQAAKASTWGENRGAEELKAKL